MLKKKYEKKPCIVDGCDLQRRIKGYCKGHYKRIVLNIEPSIPKEKKITIPCRKFKVLCEVNNCDRFSRVKNMCSMHYGRVKRHGDTGTNYHRKYRSTLISFDNVLRPHMPHFSTADEKEAMSEILWDKSDILESSDIYY